MKKRDFKFILFLITCTYLLSSCTSVKQLTLFQKLQNESDTINVIKASTSVIQTGDIISVYVTSLSPTASTFFNPYPGGGNTTTSSSSVQVLSSQESPGYLVDPTGNIELPLVGTISVAGLTTIQAKEQIKKKLEFYLKEPTVILRIVNYHITLLGEVTKPAVYTIPNERVTLPEVISLAGDLTQFGRRDNIMIIREVNGKKTFGHVNLNNREVYNSPYYYLRSNDLVYVEPSAGKSIQNNSFFRVFPIVASAITLAIALFTRVF